MTDKLARTQEEVSGYLDDIAACFKPGIKLTLIVRTPGFPDRDFLMTSDDIDEAVALLRRRQESSLPVASGD